MATTYPYASAEKIQEALAITGLPVMPQTTVPLLQGIALALANRGGGGGDPVQNTITALGGSPIGQSEETLFKQILVLAATATT